MRGERVLRVPGRLALLGVLCVLGLAFAPGASADVTFCEGAPEPLGSEAGHCALPSSVAVDSGAGVVYVADTNNNRVDAFTVNGGFLWAFGLGVIDGSSETLQTCTATCKKGKEPSGFVPQDVSEPTSVAVDSVSGAVYVFSKLGVRKFTIDHNGTPGDPTDDFAVFERLWGGGVVRSGASGTGNLSSGSATVTNVKTTAKRFLVGQPITGTGIPAETKIEALGEETITLSKAATASGTNVALTAPDGVGNVPADEVQELAFANKHPGIQNPLQAHLLDAQPLTLQRDHGTDPDRSIRGRSAGGVRGAAERRPRRRFGDGSRRGTRRSGRSLAGQLQRQIRRYRRARAWLQRGRTQPGDDAGHGRRRTRGLHDGQPADCVAPVAGHRPRSVQLAGSRAYLLHRPAGREARGRRGGRRLVRKTGDR